MNVLSLFDGMSCGRIALERASVLVQNYYASEIDKYAIKVTQENYPDTIQLGDINNWREWKIDGDIDLILAGSPCQGFSFAGKGLDFEDERSALFFQFIEVLKHYKPKKFLLENVIMSQESNDVISSMLGDLYPGQVEQPQLFQAGRLEPIQINSALVSAQSRDRLYWTNIEDVSQPEDRGIVLKDITEDGANKAGNMVNRRINPATGRRDDYNKEIERHLRIEVRSDHKVGALLVDPTNNPIVKTPDAKCILVGMTDSKGADIVRRVYSQEGKSPALTARCGGNQEKKIAVGRKHWRKLTCLEYERLQTVLDGYTDYVSNTQRYKMLGNGWTIEVIVHILKNLN